MNRIWSCLAMFILVLHGTPKRDWNREKMPGYDTHIFWLGIPQGSQKCSNENIPCVSWQDNAVFLILVGKMTPNLVEKAAFLVLYCWFLKKFDAIIQNQMAYVTFSKPVDDYRQKQFENRSKNGQFAAFWYWISPFYLVNETFYTVFYFKWLHIGHF